MEQLQESGLNDIINKLFTKEDQTITITLMDYYTSISIDDQSKYFYNDQYKNETFFCTIYIPYDWDPNITLEESSILDMMSDNGCSNVQVKCGIRYIKNGTRGTFFGYIRNNYIRDVRDIELIINKSLNITLDKIEVSELEELSLSFERDGNISKIKSLNSNI